MGPTASGGDFTWRLRFSVAAELQDAVSAELADSPGFLGVDQGDPSRPDPEATWSAYFAPQADAAALRSLAARLGGDLGRQPAEDWQRRFRELARPRRVGRFVLDPREPEAGPPPPGSAGGDDWIRVPARQAFGSGSHATTRLMIRQLLEAVERGAATAGQGLGAVLDVGTGTGVLLLVASRLGAARPLGLDLDPAAVFAARDNALRDGRADRLRLLCAPIGAVTGAFDVVLANVLPENLAGSEEGVATALRPGGLLILGGWLEERGEELLEPWMARGFELVRATVEEEWLAVTLTRGAR